MTSVPRMTAEEFAERRWELPDDGRWTELVAGEVISLGPPEPLHGSLVLNLSKALGAYAQSHADQPGYACFELGLILARDPDTVRCPAISYFLTGPRFDDLDETITTHRPDLVVEIPSTPERRRDMPHRLEAWVDWGVPVVWVFYIDHREVLVHTRDRPPVRLGIEEQLTGAPLFEGFSASLKTLFAEPDWWAGSGRSPSHPSSHNGHHKNGS